MLGSTRGGEDGGQAPTVLEAKAPTRALLFAAGRGGDPRRHHLLLENLANAGCTVIAPHFAMMAPTPEPVDMRARLRRLHRAMRACPPGLPLLGVGHSVGAALLLGLVGAQLWTRTGPVAPGTPTSSLRGLVLMAPASDFLGHPSALEAVDVPLLILAGERDRFVPPSRLAELSRRFPRPDRVGFESIEDADHFSFMDDRPPNQAATSQNEGRCVEQIRNRVLAFVRA